jgi:hypothetical protein
MKKEENNSLTPFEARFMREGPFMPYGSNMNAFATINQGKGISIKEFKEIANEIFELSMDQVRKAIKMSKEMQSKELDFPKK